MGFIFPRRKDHHQSLPIPKAALEVKGSWIEDVIEGFPERLFFALYVRNATLEDCLTSYILPYGTTQVSPSVPLPKSHHSSCCLGYKKQWFARHLLWKMDPARIITKTIPATSKVASSGMWYIGSSSLWHLHWLYDCRELSWQGPVHSIYYWFDVGSLDSGTKQHSRRWRQPYIQITMRVT